MSDLLEENHRTFQALVARSERLLAAGRPERAAVASMHAATFACFNHTGLFASDRLEAVLTALSAGDLPGGPARPAAPPAAAGVRRVLHVATQVYGTGGHTQMLAQWVTADAGRAHHLVLTHQAGQPLPDKVRHALGGAAAITVLDEPFTGLLGRAAVLRDLAADFDHVVLHVHPYDVVPSIALTARPGPEVLYVNHADHLFWVGTHALDRLVDLRASGRALAVERRGVPEGRNCTLIRPLDLRPRGRARSLAKAELGIGPDRVVVASAAAGFKYEPVDGRGFLDVVGPVIAQDPDAHLLVAGPDPVGEWAGLESRGLGRATGLLPDARPVLEAADVYVDSYPFSSLTSLLEAASLGVPVLTLRAPSPDPAVLDADTPELADHLQVAGSPDELRLQLGWLVGDAAARDALGEATGRAVHEAHADGRWRRAVDRLLEPPARGCGPAPLTPAVRRTGDLDTRVALMMDGAGRSGRGGSATALAPFLTWGERMATAAELVRERRRPSASLLLPAWVVRRITSLRSRRPAD